MSWEKRNHSPAEIPMTRYLCAGGLCALWAATIAAADEPAQKLLAEGDRLADKAEYTEALLRYKGAYEKILPGLRGLTFKNPVAPQFMERKDLREHMAKLFREEMTEEDIALADASLKVFGFVPAKFKTEELVLRLYAEEVAGFYDPKRKEIFLIKETEKPQKPGLFARLLGATGGFDKEEQKATLAHEMAHALADQHFDLDKMQRAVEDDDDQSLALQALIEGEATLVMMIDMQRTEGDDGKEMLKASPEAMDFSIGLMKGFLPFASGKTFRNAPPIFQETMLFGYLKGLVFLLHLTNDDEWDAVNRAFRSPPLSTEQILHPEKYLRDVDVPVAIDLPKFGALAAGGWKELGQNVLGELQISILLRRHWGRQAAAGWDGDRFAVFDGPDERLGVVWFTTWDSETDAIEFAGAYTRYSRGRLGLDGDAKDAAKGNEPPKVADDVRSEHDGAVYRVVRRGADVIVIEGFPTEMTDKMLDAATKSQKRPKTIGN
jgi:hypothetical protein